MALGSIEKNLLDVQNLPEFWLEAAFVDLLMFKVGSLKWIKLCAIVNWIFRKWNDLLLDKKHFYAHVYRSSSNLSNLYKYISEINLYLLVDTWTGWDKFKQKVKFTLRKPQAYLQLIFLLGKLEA